MHVRQTNIQRNLVTRDGQLAKELDRNRELCIRVGARMSNLSKMDKRAGVRSGTEVAQREANQTERLRQVWEA